MSNEKSEKSVNMVAPPPDQQATEKYFAEHCEGRRASFTVTTKGPEGERRYDADHLSCTFLDGTMEPALSFVCSGRMTTVKASEVESVEFGKPKAWYYQGQKLWQGTSHCSTCDGQLKHLVKRPG